MNKSLRVKLSVTLMATVLTTMVISVLVNNFFLVDYYISGKQKALISAYNQINQIDVYKRQEYRNSKESQV